MKARIPAFIALSLAMLIAGAAWSVKWTTDDLLYTSATETSRKWANYLTDNLVDLPEIARGERPSVASAEFLMEAQKINLVFRYEIFNREGFPQLMADARGVQPVEVSDVNPSAVRAARSGLPVVAVRMGSDGGWPSFFAEAYVPIWQEGETIGVVAAYVDQTHEHETFVAAFLGAATVVCGLTVIAFCIPAIAWYRRNLHAQRADAEIMFLAKHDAMTRVANRNSFLDQLGARVAAIAGTDAQLAVHYVDLDRFKEINDTFGHAAGDELIRQMVRRLEQLTLPVDLIGRMGGDEFAIAQPIGSLAEAETLAGRIIEGLAKPFAIAGCDLSLTASIGIAVAPRDGTDSDPLVRRADLALYRSKSEGRDCYRFFTADMDAAVQARARLEERIREATRRDGFELHFQPIVHTQTRRTRRFEALLRLRAEDGTFIPAATFIPVAEDMGLIARIGAWVIREACRAAATWPAELTVAVNVSPSQFQDGGLIETVRGALAEFGLPAARLELEVTEALLLNDTDAILAELTRLERTGVSIAMDDFGTGYSSLSYLWRFPFDRIKVDRSFMTQLTAADHNAGTIVETIVGLAHSLAMQVTVEGIETADQLAFASRAQCDEVQGFFLGRPMPECDLAGHLAAELQRECRASEPRGSAGDGVRRAANG